MALRKIAVLLCLLVSFFLTTVVHAMSEEERSFLSMYFSDDELQVISATRSLKSISRVAENVEVVTKDDIELMNAHTVAEALANVTGVEMWDFVGPGANGVASIDGSDYTRVTVLLDGVPLTNEEHAVMLGVLPVQMIERIEIIKGPASSTWGSSFGGVINIITKSIESGDHPGGSLYASGGEHNTSDARAEVYGKKGIAGIYLYAGTLNSDGLIHSHNFWNNNLFTKLSLDAGQKTKIDLSFFYHKGDSVQWDYRPLGYDIYHGANSEYIYGKAALTTALRPDVDLNLYAWTYLQDDTVYEFEGSGNRLWDSNEHFDKYGINGNLTWRTGQHTVVAGTDMFEGREKWDFLPGETLTQRDYAIFMNDTIKLGEVGITPGIRYDNSNIGGDFVSPSLGTTWMATKDILFRAEVARGFHDPELLDTHDSPGYQGNPGIRPEKIWSYQAGVEANIVDLFRAKLTLFFHDISDMIIYQDLGNGLATNLNAGKVRSIGGEAELSTREYKGFTLKGGFHYENMKNVNFSTDSAFDSTNRYGFNTSLSYKGQGLRAILQGHYMWWNLPADYWGAEYNGFILDFNIAKDILKTKSTTLETFFTAHNIFDGVSYDDNYVMNPGRWIEGGVRYKF